MGPIMTHYRSLWESNEEMKRPRQCCCWQLPDNGWWKLLVPSLRIHLFQLTKDFFYGKEVRKAQPFSGMLWLTWNFRHLPLKFVFCQWLKGLQHFLVTWSMITRFISGESWFKKFLLVIKITMINSDFKIFSLKSFPTRLERPDSRRQGKLNVHVHVNNFFISTWPRWMKGDINRF